MSEQTAPFLGPCSFLCSSRCEVTPVLQPLPPHGPQLFPLGLRGTQSLLQHFVISQEHFRPIFLFLISLIDFLNYVPAQRCFKKYLTQQQLTAKLLKPSFHSKGLLEPEIISIILKPVVFYPWLKRQHVAGEAYNLRQHLFIFFFSAYFLLSKCLTHTPWRIIY